MRILMTLRRYRTALFGWKADYRLKLDSALWDDAVAEAEAAAETMEKSA